MDTVLAISCVGALATAAYLLWQRNGATASHSLSIPLPSNNAPETLSHDQAAQIVAYLKQNMGQVSPELRQHLLLLTLEPSQRAKFIDAFSKDAQNEVS